MTLLSRDVLVYCVNQIGSFVNLLFALVTIYSHTKLSCCLKQSGKTDTVIELFEFGVEMTENQYVGKEKAKERQ